jgi:DNA-directed RNA polymerase specialized sigma24 family protein
MLTIIVTVGIIMLAAVLIPLVITAFLRDVDAGSIRLVTWWRGNMRIYRGPGKSYEVPLLTNGTTISSKAINVDLDITDQTADVDRSGVPNPIKVRVLASAIVSVGDSDQLIKTAANRFFAKTPEEQMAALTDLLASAGRRAVNLLTHDQLFSAKSTTGRSPMLAGREDHVLLPVTVAAEDDDDPLAIIIRKACSRELTDLGLVFNSLNIKIVQSEVAEARRRQSAAEATANAEIVAANQHRRGQAPEDAQDLTQGFFLQLLEHRMLATADQRKGKFRSFLLAAFQHYLSDQADRARCLKRGGHREFISLDLESAEGRYQREPAGIALTAEQLFDARWAILLLGRAKMLLSQEYEVQGRAAIFEALKPFLESGAPTPSYEAAANALGMGLGTTKTLIHRLRKRYTAILRQEIARTVSDPSEVDAEIHALCEALIASKGQMDP